MMRRVICLASCLVLTCLVATARAEYTSDSALLNNLNQILRDPNKQLALTPDRSAVVFMSKRAEVSFGADCKMKLHSAGTYKRMTDLTKGFRVNMGEALGHKEQKDPTAVGCLVKLVKDQGLNWGLRSNGIGFAAKSYSAKTRPLDMWCSSMKLSVAPGGACTIKKLQRGPLGFGGTKPKAVQQGTPRIATAIGRPLPSTSYRTAGPRCQTSFAPMAKSNFKLQWGGARRATK